MDTITTIVLFIGGIVLLVAGAELLVRGASSLALAAGISPLVIGLTVVAFVTSAPELSVTLQSTLNGTPDLAVGNIIGSNITNILLVLGLVGAIAPFSIDQRLVRLDVPILIGCSLLFFGFAWQNGISQGEGAILFSLLVGYLLLAVHLSRRESRAVKKEYRDEYKPLKRKASALSILKNLLLCGLGVGSLVLGSDWLVSASVSTARTLGIDELIIGLTIIAIGTSLPEIATSVMAAVRGKREIATGNVIGSNLFNLLFVGGTGAILTPGGLAVNNQAIGFDLPVMLAATIACLPIFYRGYRIDHWEGWVFIFYYVAYVAFLVLATIRHEVLPVFNSAILYFALPLTTLTVIVLVWRWHQRSRV